MRCERDIEVAAALLGSEWLRLAQMAARLAEIQGVRTADENALMDAFMVLDRVLINFLCGGTKGGRDKRDIQPQDFLGINWRPTNDRRLRGRLEVIGTYLSHLSWYRLTRSDPIMWATSTLAQETSAGMSEFVDEMLQRDAPGASMLERLRVDIRRQLP